MSIVCGFRYMYVMYLTLLFCFSFFFFFLSFFLSFFTQSVQEIFQTLIKEIENHDQDGNVDKKEDCTILWHACMHILCQQRDCQIYFLWYSFLHSTLSICYRHLQFVWHNSFRQPYMLLPRNSLLVLNSLKLLKRCFRNIWPDNISVCTGIYLWPPWTPFVSRNIFISLEFPSTGCTL